MRVVPPALSLLLAPALAGCFGALLPAPEPGLEDVAGPPSSAASRDAEGCYANAAGGCVVTTPGCDPSALQTPGGEVCARCEGSGRGDVEICGTPEEARCFDLEAPAGGACQRCVTETGAVLYDDCAADLFDGDLSCETVQQGEGATDALDAEVRACRSDADCGAGEACFLGAPRQEGVCEPLSDGVRCEVCTDGRGQVVREVCRPEADQCEEVQLSDGRVCTECTLNGQLAWRDCSEVDLDPRVCEAYGDGAARCVDCYGAAGELLLHRCTLPAATGKAAAGFCDVEALPGGGTCTTCFDPNGGVVSETCDETSDWTRCEELVFTDQRCVVCVDAGGAAQFTDCRRRGCAEGEGCPPPPACEVREAADGAYCRVCPVEGIDEREQRCMSSGALFCSFEDRFEEPSDPDRSVDESPSGEVCLVCADIEGGEEAYRSCADNGPEPPVCVVRDEEGGARCEICYDAANGAEVYSSCGAAPAPAAGQCSADAARELLGPDQERLRLPGSEAPAVAACEACGLDAGAPERATCWVQPPACPEDTAASAAPGACSLEVERYRYEATQCADPWGSSVGPEGLRGLLGWLLGRYGILGWSAESVSTPLEQGCAACDCPAGVALTLYVDPDYEDVMLELGFTR